MLQQLESPYKAENAINSGCSGENTKKVDHRNPICEDNNIVFTG